VQASGFVSPVQALRTFLKRVPDHLEARERLLHLLRRQAGALTRAKLGEGAFPEVKATPGQERRALQLGLPKAGVLLKGEDDLRIWGPVYQELERLYASQDWLVLDHRAFVRGELGEAASPLMHSLLRRHRPALLASLRETPQDTNLLTHWTWASVVLGEPLLPVLETLPPYPPLPAALGLRRLDWPGEAAQSASVFEALATGDHARCGRLRLSMWQIQAAYLSLDMDEEPLRRLWSEWALPGLESFLRAGMPEAGDPFFESLGGLPGAPERVAEAASLAIRMGRRDVAEVWQSRRLKPGLPDLWIPFPGLLVTTASKAPVLTYTPEVEAGQQVVSTSVQTLALGALDPRQKLRGEAWRSFLGWGASEARWALVDPKGLLLLEGAEPLDPAEVQRRLQDLPLTKESPAWAYRRLTDPWLRQLFLGRELSALQQEIHMELGAQVPASPSAAPSPVPEACLDRWVTRVRALEDLREAGLWRRRLPIFYGAAFSSRTLDDARLVSAARAWVAALEAELVRRPRAFGLWGFWRQWLSLIPEPDFAGLEARLERPPLDEQPWPPMELVDAWLSHAGVRERWSTVVDVARPRWEAAMTEGKTASGLERVWRELGLPLAEALLKLGRGEEADRILAQVVARGLPRERAMGWLWSKQTLQKRWAPESSGH